MTNTPPSPAPQEYQMVRLTAAAHAKLKELAEAQKRSMSNQAEVLIETAHTEMTRPAEANVFILDQDGNMVPLGENVIQAVHRMRPTPANRPPAIPLGG